MLAIVAKFFLGIILTLISIRILGFVFALFLGFLAYKYFTDPGYVNDLFNNLQNTIHNILNDTTKESTTEETAETATLIFYNA